MVINFDIFDNFEKPSMVLCNPNKKPLKSLSGVAYDINIVLRYNSMSEISLTVPYYVNGEVVDCYNEIKSKRLIEVADFGYFLITTINETGDGIKKTKQITAYSLEAELNYKKINLFSGTYKFYDPITPNDTLLGKIVKYIPSWTIGYIDSDLWNKYRTFDISDQTIYNFLITNIEQSFECIFTFDTVAKTINAYSTKNAVKDTSIFLSFDNLLKNVNIEEMSEELVTALHCYGSGDLDIRTVNPLGSPIIYNFDYFLYNTDQWMSTGLKNAVIAWNNKIVQLQPIYATYLANFRTKNLELIVLEGQLTALQSEYTALESVQKARISAGEDYSDIYTQMITKEAQIESKKVEVRNKENEIVLITDSLKGINEQLSFLQNFTNEQYVELSNYMIEGTYQNEAFVQTSEMTPVEIQNMAQELYDQSSNVLKKLSQPRFSFAIDSTNFLFLKEFKPFTDQLSLGSQINIDIGEGMISYPVLLELSFSFDNPTDFSMTFGNRLRLDKNDFVFAELFGDSVNGGNTISFNSTQWSDWSKNYEDTVSQFITSSLDCAKNSVINATNQEIVIDSNGLKGQKFLPATSTYDPRKVWLTNNTLAFTKNNWQTASLAIGEVANGAYGVVAEVIVGKMLAGNQLQITNDKNNFLLDSNGCILNNASFTLTTSNNKGKIILDPVQGIKIQGNTGSGFVDKFFVDTSGNVNFTGKLNGATGSFSGELTSATFKSGSININEKFKVDSLGNCIANSISINNGSFNAGTINGTNLTASNISGGTITGATINGGNINVDTDLYIGRNIYMRATGDAGYINVSDRYGSFISSISLGRNSTQFSNEVQCNGLYSSGVIDCTDDLTCRGYIYEGGDRVATRNWVLDKEYGQREDIPANAVYNPDSQLLKFYNYNGYLLFDVELA